LNFDEGELQIHHVSQMNNIKRVKIIAFDSSRYLINSAKTTSLQIINNLIVLHFFESAESLLYDLRNDFTSQKFCLSSEEIYSRNKKQEIISPRIVFDEDDERNDTFNVVLNYNIIDIIPMNSRENKALCKSCLI
jgi:hypothetical protein